LAQAAVFFLGDYVNQNLQFWFTFLVMNQTGYQCGGGKPKEA